MRTFSAKARDLTASEFCLSREHAPALSVTELRSMVTAPTLWQLVKAWLRQEV